MARLKSLCPCWLITNPPSNRSGNDTFFDNWANATAWFRKIRNMLVRSLFGRSLGLEKQNDSMNVISAWKSLQMKCRSIVLDTQFKGALKWWEYNTMNRMAPGRYFQWLPDHLGGMTTQSLEQLKPSRLNQTRPWINSGSLQKATRANEFKERQSFGYSQRSLATMISKNVIGWYFGIIWICPFWGRVSMSIFQGCRNV